MLLPSKDFSQKKILIPHWIRRTLLVNFKEAFSSATLYILTVLFLAIWYFYAGKHFEWHWIEPLEVPPYERLFYSALFFVGPGYVLYRSKVYLVLYYLLDFRDFKEIKAIILMIATWFMYFKVIPWIVSLLNDVISIGYNIFNLILYIAPWFAISIFVSLIYLFLRQKYPSIKS